MLLPLLLLFQGTANWTVGEEREVHPGVFATLYAEDGRWRIWKSENGGSPRCVLTQGAINDQVLPLGLHPYVFAKTTWLEIWDGGSYWKMNGLGDKASISYRLAGEKFFKDRSSAEWFKFKEGQQVEVKRVAWEYPLILKGRIEHTISLDMTGLTANLAQLKQCEKEKRSG